MKLAIITHVHHIWHKNAYYGYSAYVREMNIWGTHASQLLIAAPLIEEEPSEIHLPYDHKEIHFTKIPFISITSFSQLMRTMVLMPILIAKIWNVLRKSDHIHLRCPGSIALIGCFLQIFFPKKPKTAKYAGNWDPNSKQPLSYRIQKWIISNTFLTRNMTVLAYGEWPDQSKNIKSFFTASYSNSKVAGIKERSFQGPFKFMFVGSLSPGKRPIYVLQLIEAFSKQGIDCTLDFFGDGTERGALEHYIKEHSLKHLVTLHGNENAAVVEAAYQKSHFLVLPSKSEGWPKVLAEAMFWGCIPVATNISCVPWMLSQGSRGVLINTVLKDDIEQLEALFSNEKALIEMSKMAQKWSHQYTLEHFDSEIKKFLI